MVTESHGFAPLRPGIAPVVTNEGLLKSLVISLSFRFSKTFLKFLNLRLRTQNFPVHYLLMLSNVIFFHVSHLLKLSQLIQEIKTYVFSDISTQSGPLLKPM